ncbi:1-aminocyclopropane-1-carboxylate oxidase-like 3 [Hondaea fermentalgiana]|uniref:1-aminocyclopropane-1-carboxylate oxidase-like 3 n=1 Tax=Hondaea fermentalgiana TaxID=2315210 RepID=A0A2R5G745_9STRA|nr:1-aminocyclopropane-1-carboxylate oxidase-like 3 [Hondaea fermentalgiana]|eukprot:GBG26877.1 1-aminocyclopropane-1-carboxylate oxidase-like 3 [Hondaea fermentalgiana]
MTTPERPKEFRAGREPPVINLGGAEGPIVHEIADACERWGFFQVVNHDVNPETIRLFDESVEAFFAQPSDLKRKVKRHADNSRGWFDDELTKQTPDFKEVFDVGEEGDFAIDGTNQWPDEPTRFRTDVKRYFCELETLALRLAGYLAQALSLETQSFDPELRPNTSFLRINYYPVCTTRAAPEDWNSEEEPKPDKDGVFSVNRHTDSGMLTVLRQREGDPCSLQVFDRVAQRWTRVHPAKGAFIINIGDVCQVWSNDRFQSPVHRVLANPEQERYSAPFFLNPSYEAVMQKRTLDDVPPRYRPFTWGEFRRRRFEGDLEDTGKADVQISDYQIAGRL